ncbi:hypothetical protein V6N12_030257 [Hibiscus sabdariffa]|uniref:Uncharacterized protein n=1 Tax=Hibiscus sabdariffa TaxID=183260 RepID=A0ABR2C1W6_9ROSI
MVTTLDKRLKLFPRMPKLDKNVS